MDIAPYSGAIEAGSNLVNAVISRIWPDKTKVAEIQAQIAQQIAAGEYANELATITAVNASMQAEAKSEHWAQWLWRPTIGFTFAGVIANNYILMPYFAKLGLQLIAIPDNVWTAMLVILGASAATRGWQKAVEAGRK